MNAQESAYRLGFELALQNSGFHKTAGLWKDLAQGVAIAAPISAGAGAYLAPEGKRLQHALGYGAIGAGAIAGHALLGRAGAALAGGNWSKHPLRVGISEGIGKGIGWVGGGVGTGLLLPDEYVV